MPSVTPSLIIGVAELVHAAITPWLLIVSRVTHRAALIPAEGEAASLLQISHSPRPFFFILRACIMGLIDILYPALLCSHFLLSVDFFLHPPPFPTASILHPPSSHLNPAVRYHSPLACCRGGQLLALAPPLSRKWTVSPPGMTYMDVGIWSTSYSTLRTPFTSLCAGRVLTYKWVKTKNKRGTLCRVGDRVRTGLSVQAAHVWGAFN